MDTRFWIEIFGYIGSAVVLISFMMSNVIKLRIINSIGGLLSTIYSVIVGAYPVAIMNICLICINLYYIWKMTHDTKAYHAVMTNPDDASLQYFLKEYEKDIEKEWNTGITKPDCNFAAVVYADGVPASLLLAKRNGKNLDVQLDYAMPAYRDTTAGKYIYSQLKKEGIDTASTSLPDDNGYFAKMGFQKDGNRLTKTL